MVSIIILSYNTKNLLHQCLDSIYTHIPDLDFEIIVVDNASTDKSVEMVKSEFKKVQVIQNKQNVGFTKGNNIGAERALGEYLLFLNSDTMFHNKSLKEMVEFLHSHAVVGIVGGKLLNYDGTPQRSCGRFYDPITVFFMLFAKEYIGSILSNSDMPKKVDWVSGACLLISKELFNKVGKFDTAIFMYMEDMELCYRVNKEGYETYYYPPMTLIHAGQGSSNRAFAIMHIYKGLLYFYQKHKSSFEYTIVKSMLITKANLAILFGKLTHNTYLIDTYTAALHF